MNIMLLSTILYALIFVLVYFSTLSGKDTFLKPAQRQTAYIGYGAALAVIFVVQMLACTISKGYTSDFGLFKVWTSFGNEHHLWEYYTSETYVDYPPVFLYVLYGMGKLASLFRVSPDSTAYMYFMRFPSILCDAGITLFIFLFAKDKVGDKKAAALALLSAINPANIVNSTVWGQVDSFSTLTILGLLMCLYNRKYIWAAVLMAVSFLTKPQNIIFMPVFGLTYIFDLIDSYKQDRETFKKFVLTCLYALLAFVGTVLAISLPITGGNLWLIVERYLHALGLYQYTTLNAANIYGAIGANAQPDSSTFLFVPYKVWGFVFITVMVAAIIFLFARSKSRSKILFAGAFTSVTIFLFAHNMHERYLYSLMLLLMTCFIVLRNRRLLWLYGGFSLLHFWNVGMVLDIVARRPNNPYFAANDPFFIILSWLHIALYAVLVYIGWRTYIKPKEGLAPVAGKMGKQGKGPAAKQEKRDINPFHIHSLQEEQEQVRTTRVDLILIAALMLVYSIFAFYKLGSLDTPQTGWYPTQNNERLELTFEQPVPIRQLYLHYGWMDRRRADQNVERELTVRTSQDGERWNEPETFKINDVFKFAHFTFEKTAQYVTIEVDEGNFYLNEIAFYGETEDERYIPVSAVSPVGNETASLAIDEPERMVYRYTWYDEAYFDEIYHPRTAYENLTHRYPFENTHPPLGKVIIAAGMKLFGVTPFGWRFFGTLSGVLMVPLAYMLGKKMFKKSFYGFISAVLFTFDFMHLSQTRLATIDSFTTLFVMGMFYYMYQYYTRSFYNVGVKKTLYPLFMSGLFFALGIATKWQGAYAGVGLAAVFFMSLGRRYLEYRWAAGARKPDARQRHVLESFRPMAVKTLLFAVLFFVVIPGVVYFLSYIPAMNTPTTGLEFFFTNQSSMFNYHSTLDATHPYGSQWWSWPLDIRPLYSYTAPSDFVPEGMSMGMASFGNPLVWWMMIPALVGAVWLCVKGRGSKELTVIFTGFAALYVPWMFVTRVCFIYHFFPVVIFGVLLIVYCIRYLLEQKIIKPWMVYAYLGVVVLLFIAFYPVLTGMMIPRWYMQCLKWFPSWVFG